MTQRLFVYGTLKREEWSRDFIAWANFISKDAEVEGFDLFQLGVFPGAKPGKGVVKGHLAKLDQALLSALDHYEGHPHFFKRELVHVKVKDNDKLDGEAWMYIFQPDVSGYPQLKDGEWPC